MKNETRALLRKRAAEMAREPELVTDESARFDLVTFTLSSEIYGIESDYVREVYPMKDFTPLPGTPSYILGVINVRGKVLAVIDLKKFFNLPTMGLGELNKVIILSNDDMEFGILADTVLGAQTISAADVRPAPQTVGGIGEDFLMGVTTERMMVLSAVQLLTDTKIIVDNGSN